MQNTDSRMVDEIFKTTLAKTDRWGSEAFIFNVLPVWG